MSLIEAAALSVGYLVIAFIALGVIAFVISSFFRGSRVDE